MRMGTTLCAMTVAIGGLLGGCASPDGKTLAQQREYTRQMARDTLTEVKQLHPDLAARMSGAPGYAVFSGWDSQIGVLGTGNSYGIARITGDSREHFMRMGGLNVGIGLGAKGSRVVMLFNDADTLHTFIHDGWEFGAQASGAATAKHYGDTAEAVGSFYPVEVYQITHTGLIAKAVLSGAKVWRDGELNIDPPTIPPPTATPAKPTKKPASGY